MRPQIEKGQTIQLPTENNRRQNTKQTNKD